MKEIKATDSYTVYEKRSGRYAVKDAKRHWINGDDKAKILLDEGLIKKSAPKPAEPEAAEGDAEQAEAS